ncbi:hypothetical protein PMAYCL1PPCAC_25405, partial [Pristionchus mayeri]
MRIKTTTTSYCVSRTCQIRENIALLKQFNKVAFPLVLTSFIASSFFMAYRFLPKSIGLDNVRYICAAMFNLVVAISCAIVLAVLPLFERQIVNYLIGKSMDNVHTSSESQEHSSVTNAYFTMLNK